MPPNSEDELNKEELTRVDNLLGAARAFHYSAFVLSGISLVLSSLEKTDNFKLPIGDVVIPHLQTVVGIYLLVLVLSVGAERTLRMVYPWIKKDRRRPPFAWIALGPRGSTLRSVTFWLVLPIVVCGISAAISLDKKDFPGYLLSFVGAVVFMMPRVVEENLYLIMKRLDDRGGPITFSVWLLYWYRLGRGIFLTAYLFAPVIALVPQWRSPIWDISRPVLLFYLGVFILRAIGGLPFFYRRIDRLGSRFGFPIESKHYK